MDIIERAGRMFDNEIGDKKNAVQFTCDFLHIPTTSYVLGVCGVDDFNKRFWVTTSVICHTERGETALKTIGRQVDLINADIRARKDKALIDGANALKSACAKVEVKGRGCFTHTTRLALQRGGGKQGSEGSICNYLIGTMKLKHKDAAKVSPILLAYVFPCH